MPNLLLQWNMRRYRKRVNVAVHDATLVPVPGLTGRSPTAIAQEVARDREERGRKPVGLLTVGSTTQRRFETDKGCYTLAGDGFRHLHLVYMSNGLAGALCTLCLNGMLMNVPADEISAYPNVMPTMVQGPRQIQWGRSIAALMKLCPIQVRNHGFTPAGLRQKDNNKSLQTIRFGRSKYDWRAAQSEALAAWLQTANLGKSRANRHQKKYLDQWPVTALEG